MPTALDQELRNLRVLRRLSLGTAAALANVSKSALSAWENGTSRPRGAGFARLLDALEAEPRLRARLLHAADPAFARVELVHSPLGAPVEVGAVVRAMRARRGLTQADLARRVGLTQSAVAHWEAGDAVPPADTLHAIGFALGATVEETLALASARNDEKASLPDDPEAAFAQLGHNVFDPLWEVVNLGWEAEIWPRAARDPRWDRCLIRVLAGRANWLVGQERHDEIAAPARRAIGMARTTEERRQAVPAVAALADLDRHRGAGHASAAEAATAWAELLPEDEYGAWMLHQRGISLARMGRGDEGAALVDRAARMNLRRGDLPEGSAEAWVYRTGVRCEARLAAGEALKAAALIGGRREPGFCASVYVRIEHAGGRAATDADMAHLRYVTHRFHGNVQGRRGLERIERRQARLTGGEPMPLVPCATDAETGDRLWAAVLRDNRG